MAILTGKKLADFIRSKRKVESGSLGAFADVELTAYTHTAKDRHLDSNTANLKGNANNLLRHGSLALSPPLRRALERKAKRKLEAGDAILCNGKLIGYYEDTNNQKNLNLDFFFPRPAHYSNNLRSYISLVTLDVGEPDQRRKQTKWSEEDSRKAKIEYLQASAEVMLERAEKRIEEKQKIKPKKYMNKKPFYLSKTVWTNLLAFVAALSPNVQEFIQKNPSAAAAILAAANFILRFISKDKISIS